MTRRPVSGSWRDSRDLAIEDANIADGVEAGLGIDDAAAFEDKIILLSGSERCDQQKAEKANQLAHRGSKASDDSRQRVRGTTSDDRGRTGRGRSAPSRRTHSFQSRTLTVSLEDDWTHTGAILSVDPGADEGSRRSGVHL